MKCLYLRHFKIKIPYPEDGYPEEMVSMVVKEIINKYDDKFISCKDEKNVKDMKSLQKEAINIMVSYIKSTLSSIGVVFDRWFFESVLYNNSNFENNNIYDVYGRGIFVDSYSNNNKIKSALQSKESTFFPNPFLYVPFHSHILILKR